jgi:hypothetical protein
MIKEVLPGMIEQAKRQLKSSSKNSPTRPRLRKTTKGYDADGRRISGSGV